MENKTGICPVCNGTMREPATGDYKSSCYGYDKETDTLPCTNCGGQKQWGEPTGIVRLREDGTPCKHEYRYALLGNCYHGYSCKYCADSYTIDSGD